MDSPEQTQKRARAIERLLDLLERQKSNGMILRRVEPLSAIDEFLYELYHASPWLLDAAQERDRLRTVAEECVFLLDEDVPGKKHHVGELHADLFILREHKRQLRAQARDDAERIQNLKADRLKVEQHNAELRDNATVDAERIRALEEALSEVPKFIERHVEEYGDDAHEPRQPASCCDEHLGRHVPLVREFVENAIREALRGATGDK